MNDIQFNSANTRIRTYETQLLDKPQMERLITSKNAQEAYSILQETVYGDFIEEHSKVHDFEDVLLAELQRVYQNLYQLTPIKEVVDFFALKYDYQNLKVLVKSAYTKQDFSDLLVPIGTVALSSLKELVATRKSTYLPQVFVSCIQEVFDFIENYHEIQSIDIIFDNHYWQQLLEISRSKNYQLFEELVKRNIDIFNISTALRSQLMGRKRGFINAVLAEGGHLPQDEILEAITNSLDDFAAYLQQSPYQQLMTKSYEELSEKKTLNTFDLLKDNFVMAKLKEQKIVPFGPAAMIGYLYAKEIESKNLRIIMIGKINKIPDEKIRERVRDTYV